MDKKIKCSRWTCSTDVFFACWYLKVYRTGAAFKACFRVAVYSVLAVHNEGADVNVWACRWRHTRGAREQCFTEPAQQAAYVACMEACNYDDSDASAQDTANVSDKVCAGRTYCRQMRCCLPQRVHDMCEDIVSHRFI